MKSYWNKFGKPFFWCFVFVIAFFAVIRVWSGYGNLPAVAIILAPHFDDAVLPLGGFMAESKTPFVAVTFFGGKPPLVMSEHWDAISGFNNSDEAVTTRVKENARALAETGARAINLNYLDYQYNAERDFASREKLSRSIENNIETILDSFSGAKQVSVYGPSEFGPDITHPDHKAVHDAFVAVAKKNTRKNVRFFFFEDFPYAMRYRNSTTTPLKTFLEENNPGLSLQETPILFGTSTLDKKIKAIGDYASQDKAFSSLGTDIAKDARDYARGRCASLLPRPYARLPAPEAAGNPPDTQTQSLRAGGEQACEVVYEIKN